MNVEFLEKLCPTLKLVVYLALYTAFPFAGVCCRHLLYVSDKVIESCGKRMEILLPSESDLTLWLKFESVTILVNVVGPD